MLEAAFTLPRGFEPFQIFPALASPGAVAFCAAGRYLGDIVVVGSGVGSGVGGGVGGDGG